MTPSLSHTAMRLALGIVLAPLVGALWLSLRVASRVTAPMVRCD